MRFRDVFQAFGAAQKFKKNGLRGLHEKLILSREIERKILDVVGWDRGAKRVYYGIGQEAGPVAIGDLLTAVDYLVPAYRGVAHVIGKGMAPERVLAELLAKSGGPLDGLGNPGTFTDLDLGIFPNSDTLGNNFGAAIGLGLEAERHDDHRLVAAFFGEGASTRSPFYGALNLSSLWNLPILWVCENNKYCLATRYEQMSKTGITEKAEAFGVRAIRADGNSVPGVILAARNLIDYVRREKKPALLELETYRMVRASPEDGDTYWYRNEKEYESWQARDPIALFEAQLVMLHLATRKELEKTTQRIQLEVARLADKILARPALEAGDIRRRYVPLMARAENVGTVHAPPASERPKKITIVEALRQAMDEEMARDERIILLGQEVGFYGGRRGASQGLEKRYGKARVIDAPLNEELYAGIAIGAAQAGLRPIIEFSHAAFLMLAASDVHRMGFWDIINLGKFSLPIVIRAQFGSGYDEYGEELSLSPVSALLNWKGMRMVAPSNAFQAKGLLKSALRADAPVIFFEHRLIYKKEEKIPEGEYTLPLDRGAVAREGRDATILAYGYLTALALEAAHALAREGRDIEIVDLISLKPLDEELILRSAGKTKNVLILDEEPVGRAGLSAALRLLVSSSVPEATIRELGADPLPLPFGTHAKAFLPDVQKIMDALENGFRKG